MKADVLVEVEGETLELTNLDKTMYPAAGWTKAHVVDYYRRVAPVLLPHLERRPLTMKRYPDGIEADFFYAKACPDHRPSFVRTHLVHSESTGDKRYCTVDNLPTLLWLANLADLEMHVTLARAPDVLRPTTLAFDLDPGPPADVLTCARVALRLRAVLEKLGLESWPKTSGSKGLQVYVPLNAPGVTFDDTKAFAHAMALLLEKDDPGLVVSKMTKALRKGKVFVDWSQNDDHKTTVAPYSLRAKERPTVSTPLRWDEVEDAARTKDKRALVFEAEDVLRRVERDGDLFQGVRTRKQRLPQL